MMIKAVKKGEQCQDSVIIQEDEHCIAAALADGIGTLKNSDIAASAATHTVCEWFASLGSEKISLESDDQKQAFAKAIVQKIAQVIAAIIILIVGAVLFFLIYN